MKPIILLFICLALSACGAGSGDGLNASGRPIEESPLPPEDDNTIKPTLESIQAHVFSPVCATCHGGASPAAGQDLSSIEQSIANLINVDSSNASFKRVLPGSPEESYLYLKVKGDGRAGNQMPLGGPPLEDDAVAAIKEWIAQGALVPDNAVTQTVVNNVVVNHDRLVGEPDEQTRQVSLSFWFNKPMNFSGLDPAQIAFTALSEQTEQTLGQGLIKLTSSANHILTVNISGIDSKVTQLNIGLNNLTISSLMSTDGQLLDGDADSIAGGEYIYEHQF